MLRWDGSSLHLQRPTIIRSVGQMAVNILPEPNAEPLFSTSLASDIICMVDSELFLTYSVAQQVT